MNKKRLLPGCLVLSALCLIAGCAGETRESESVLTASESFVSETDSAASLIETISETVEPISRSDRSESAEQSTLPTETTVAEVPESDQKTVLWEAPNGELFYKEDSVPDGSLLAFDQAVYRPSTGVFYDSFTNPELFDPETHEFLGDRVTYDESDWRCVNTGDTINGYTVECAKISFDVDEEVYFKANKIIFREDVILTGYLMYFSYDEPTAIIAGDFVMIPDELFQGMPRVNIYPFSKIVDGKTWENPEEFVPPAYYNDAPVIPLGNLYRDYAENEDLKALIGDGTESKKIKAEVTIGHLSLCFADMMDETWTSGKIVSVKEIE